MSPAEKSPHCDSFTPRHNSFAPSRLDSSFPIMIAVPPAMTNSTPHIKIDIFDSECLLFHRQKIIKLKL